MEQRLRVGCERMLPGQAFKVAELRHSTFDTDNLKGLIRSIKLLLNLYRVSRVHIALKRERKNLK